MRATKKQLEAVLSHASTDDTRFMLNCVWFERARIVATDGHRMAWIDAESESDHSDIDHPFAICRTDVARMLKAMAPNEIVVPADHAEQGARTFDIPGSAFRFEELSGVYPDYEKVIPKSEPTLTLCISAKYLKDACAAALKAGAEATTGKSGGAMLLQFSDDMSPVLVTSGRLSMAVMPMPMRR